MKKYINFIKLNAKMLLNLCRSRVLSPSDFSSSYDSLAAFYDDAWLVNLRTHTELFIKNLPLEKNECRQIADLGCGTGFASRCLAEKFPEALVEASDISRGMLDEALANDSSEERIHYSCCDMLDFSECFKDISFDLVFSSWAAGYSRPALLLSRISKILKPGARLALIVNSRSTLRPVFYAFEKCMHEFPGKTGKAIFPDFPKDEKTLAVMLESNSFKIEFMRSGSVGINAHFDEKGRILPWLLRTGILAGFDTVLPLSSDPVVAEAFEAFYREADMPLEHSYIEFCGRKI